MNTSLRCTLTIGFVLSSCMLSLAVAALPSDTGVIFGIMPKSASAQSVSKSYVADNGTQAGMIVQLTGSDDKKDVGRVRPATQSKLQAIHGIVVLPNDAPLSLSEATNERQVFVATSGSYTVLVSDQNGPIHKDDFITVSSIDGVGMQANPLPNVVVGKALNTFDGKSQADVKSETVVTDSNGKKRTVKFGYVTANVNVTRNPLVQNTAPNLPGFLQKAAEGIADKQVNPVRVYISIVVMLVTTIIVIVVLSTGIRASLTALGRNPLARKSIFRNLIQIVLIGLMILIVGLFGVYLLLKL